MVSEDDKCLYLENSDFRNNSKNNSLDSEVLDSLWRKNETWDRVMNVRGGRIPFDYFLPIIKSFIDQDSITNFWGHYSHHDDYVLDELFAIPFGLGVQHIADLTRDLKGWDVVPLRSKSMRCHSLASAKWIRDCHWNLVRSRANMIRSKGANV